MDTFNLVSDPNNQYIEPQVTAINTVDVKDVSLYSNVDLPQTVGVVYSNDAVKICLLNGMLPNQFLQNLVIIRYQELWKD